MEKFAFSTDMLGAGLAAETKARRWADMILEQGGISVDCPRPDRFQASLQVISCDGIVLSRAYATSIRLTRSRQHIASDEKDSITLLIGDGKTPIGGSQRGKEMVLRHGDAMVVSQAEPNATYASNGGHALAVTLPHLLLAQHVDDPSGLAARSFDRQESGLQLLGNYLRHLFMAPQLDNELASVAMKHVVELTAFVLRGGPGRHQPADADPLALPRVTLLLHAIAKNAIKPSLDIDSIGRSFAMSSRTVQNLLKNAGTTFSDELRAARLARAEELLKDRAFDHLSIVDIAHACGFADVSTFYRAFRSRGGPSPSELRTQRKRNLDK